MIGPEGHYDMLAEALLHVSKAAQEKVESKRPKVDRNLTLPIASTIAEL